MAEEATPPVTPVTPVVDTGMPVTPVTTQDITPTQTQQAPALEVKQAAETFDALNQLFDTNTPTVPPTVPDPQAPAATEPPKTTPVGTDDFQAKLAAANAPAGAHPNVQAGLNSLKELAQAEHVKAEQLANELKTYKEQLQEFEAYKKGEKLPEPIEKEINGLRERFRETDYQNTPEFQKNYVQPVREAEQTVMGLLKEAGMKDEVGKFIQENGGIIALSQSGELAGQKSDPNMTMAEWVDKMLLQPTPAVFRNRIIGKLTQAQDAIERGRADITDFRSNSKERHETRMKNMEADFNAGRNEAVAEMGDLAQLREIKATDTAEQRVASEAHNARIRKAAEQYDALVAAPKDSKTAGKLLAKAVQSDVLMGLYQEAQAEVKALRAKVDGIKAAGSHSVAGDHTIMGQDKPSMSDLLKKPTDTAMNDLFKANPALTP